MLPMVKSSTLDRLSKSLDVLLAVSSLFPSPSAESLIAVGLQDMN